MVKKILIVAYIIPGNLSHRPRADQMDRPNLTSWSYVWPQGFQAFMERFCVMVWFEICSNQPPLSYQTKTHFKMPMREVKAEGQSESLDLRIRSIRWNRPSSGFGPNQCQNTHIGWKPQVLLKSWASPPRHSTSAFIGWSGEFIQEMCAGRVSLGKKPIGIMWVQIPTPSQRLLCILYLCWKEVGGCWVFPQKNC